MWARIGSALKNNLIFYAVLTVKAPIPHVAPGVRDGRGLNCRQAWVLRVVGVCMYEARILCCVQVVGAVGLVLLLATGELAPTNVLGFCVAASNAFGLIAGTVPTDYALSTISTKRQAMPLGSLQMNPPQVMPRL